MKSTCFTLLDFEPSEDPTWRQGKLRKGNVLSVKKMINYIVRARHRWKKISDCRTVESAVEKLEVLFVYHTCQQEDIGIVNKEIIGQIIKDCKGEKCRDHLENHKSSAYQETVNLYESYKTLLDLGKKEAMADPELKGLLEVDSYILDTHKRLMRGLSMKTPGGLFSTEVRHTMADGELHQYPKFETHNEARDAVLRIVDRYNILCFSIKDQEQQDEYLFVQNSLKSIVWLFYELLSLHPFGDGNGRLCRLILNYAINVLVPFPVPLHDILSSTRDAYLHAVITPRKFDGRPTELLRLLIECTYSSCKQFFKILQVSAVELSKSNFLYSLLADARNKRMVTTFKFNTKRGNTRISHKMSQVDSFATDELVVTRLFVKAQCVLIVAGVQPKRQCTKSFHTVRIFNRSLYNTLKGVPEFLIEIYKKCRDVFLFAVRDSGHLMHFIEFLINFFTSATIRQNSKLSCVAQSYTLIGVPEFFVEIYKKYRDVFLFAVRDSGHLMHLIEFLIHLFTSATIRHKSMLSCVAQSCTKSVIKQFWNRTG